MNNIDYLSELSGIEFENLCFSLLQKMGFAVETTAVSGDGGIDLIAISNQPLFKGKYIIQCKRYSGSVGVSIIRDLYGVVTAERANKGILITTGRFTASAVAFSSDKNIELIDGEQLGVLLSEYGLEGKYNATERHYLLNPAFDVKKYEFYKSLISRRDCTEEMWSKFLFDFLYSYFELDTQKSISENPGLIYNGLASDFIKFYDVFAARFYQKGKNEQKILPYYNRKYKGLAQLYTFELFDYVQERLEILKQPKCLKLWINIEPYIKKHYSLDSIPKDIQQQVLTAVRKRDWSKIKYQYNHRYCELLNLYQIFDYFDILEGKKLVLCNLINYSSEQVPAQTQIQILCAEHHFDLMYAKDVICAPEIEIIHAKQTFTGHVYSDKDIIIDTAYNKFIPVKPYFEQFAPLNKEKISAEIEKINMLFEVI